MEGTEVQQLLLRQHGIRISASMLEYVLSKLASQRGALPVIGREARTGFPLRAMIALDQLQPVDRAPAAASPAGAPAAAAAEFSEGLFPGASHRGASRR